MRNASAIELAALQLDAVLDASGNPTVLTDERGVITRWSRAAEEFYGYSSDEAVISKDLNGIVTSWNGAAERMFGYTAAEMIGQSIRLLIPHDRQDEEDVVLGEVRRGAKVDHFDTIRRRKDGSAIPISLTVS